MSSFSENPSDNSYRVLLIVRATMVITSIPYDSLHNSVVYERRAIRSMEKLKKVRRGVQAEKVIDVREKFVTLG